MLADRPIAVRLARLVEPGHQAEGGGDMTRLGEAVGIEGAAPKLATKMMELLETQ